MTISNHAANQPRLVAANLEKIRSVVLGIGGVVLALVLPDIIDLLLLTYSLWAPGIILPVLVGVFSKTRTEGLNTLIFATMLVATGVTVGVMSANLQIGVGNSL